MNHSDDENNRDPFHVDQLILHYDYLLYKIQDYVSTIHYETTQIIKQQHELITEGIINETINFNILVLKDLLAKCENLDQYFDRIEAIEDIVDAFGERLDKLMVKYHELHSSNHK